MKKITDYQEEIVDRLGRLSSILFEKFGHNPSYNEMVELNSIKYLISTLDIIDFREPPEKPILFSKRITYTIIATAVIFDILLLIFIAKLIWG